MTARRDYLNIVDIGHILQGSQKGIRVGENPAFGGVAPVHSPTGYHPTGEAVDVTDWNNEVIDGQGWKERTASRRDRARALGFSETLGPGDKGHDSHWHLALSEEDARNKRFTKEEIQWMAAGQGPRPKRLAGQGGAAAPASSGGGAEPAAAPGATGLDALPSNVQQLLLDVMKPSAVAFRPPQIQAPQGGSFADPTGGRSPTSPYTQAMQARPGQGSARASLTELAGLNSQQPDSQGPDSQSISPYPGRSERLDFNGVDRGALNGLRGPKPKADPMAEIAGLFS